MSLYLLYLGILSLWALVASQQSGSTPHIAKLTWMIVSFCHAGGQRHTAPLAHSILSLILFLLLLLLFLSSLLLLLLLSH